MANHSRGVVFLEFSEQEHPLVILTVFKNNPETFGPDHRPIVEFALHNIQTMKLHQKIQQQYFNTNKEDLPKNNNTNEWDTHNKQLRKCNTTGDALSVAGNTDEAKNKRVRGKVSFFTTYASKVYVNLDIDYIRSLKQKFSTISTRVHVIESSNINSIPIEKEMFINRMNIKNLLESDWSADIQVQDTRTSEDNTQKTTFVLFNDMAEKILDTSAHRLFNKLSSLDNNDVPTHIQSLCRKDFIFKLKLNSYKLKEGLENFTASKLWIPDEKLELEYKLMKEKEDESEPKDHVPKELSTEKVSVDILLDKLEDHEEEVDVIDGG
ncbi:hypothetical protein FXO38_16711 [Capsicum annuum]|uniref:Replication factor A C-terminal domain-containing protein n=1 Tax=Capsicum annuum TaxID=4072 RepID=A0A2G2ZWN4_CAPAN|nr:hypothetical protein FXO38_16711 [Capsicum annuum]KAF3653418.1 hypothetical protein FXO37_16997 [Capsicum annuum]PHT86378.1 hypothetical protein T459_08484 [Capsicum annuum]